MRVGLLHPGAMGAFLGSAVAAAGHEVRWASAGRSEASARRAAEFHDVGDLDELVASCDAVLSVCPPEAALEVACAVAEAGFAGLFVDLNAVSPHTVLAIAAELGERIDVVDGGIIGGPTTGDAAVYLAGPRASDAAALIAPSVVTTRVLDGPLGSASALKACYAASSKAVSALLLSIRAAAVATDVEAPLLAEWERTMPGTVERTDRTLATIGAKAWRFGGEMREAAAFYASVGAPDGFSLAAGEVFDRLADLRGISYEPADVLERVTR